MWGWFKRRTAQSEELTTFAKAWLRPGALAAAIAEGVREYATAVKDGRIAYPAHRRTNTSVLQVWRDLRFEALHKLFNFGRSEPFLLSDRQRQLELLTCFLDERPHLEMPQPRGEVIPYTIQAVWQVYLYLDAVGSEVADPEIDHTILRSAGRTILDCLERRATELRQQLRCFDVAIRAHNERTQQLPKTLIEVFYEDITAKAKSIAFSTLFGPYHQSGIAHMERLIIKEGGDSAAFRERCAQVMAANDPDELDF